MPIADHLLTATLECRVSTDFFHVGGGNLTIIRYAVEKLMLRVKVQIETT